MYAKVVADWDDIDFPRYYPNILWYKDSTDIVNFSQNISTLRRRDDVFLNSLHYSPRV